MPHSNSPISRDPRYTWDLASIFPDVASWRRECEEVLAESIRLSALNGTLGASGEHLYKALRELDSLDERLERVGVYASLLHSQDSRNDEANKMT